MAIKGEKFLDLLTLRQRRLRGRREAKGKTTDGTFFRLSIQISNMNGYNRWIGITEFTRLKNVAIFDVAIFVAISYIPI